MALNMTTLFTRMGKGFYSMDLVNTSRGTTIPAQVLAFGNQFDSASLALAAAAANSEAAQQAYKSGGTSMCSAMVVAIKQTLVEMVKADASLAAYDETSCLKELIRQMIAAADSVDASTVGVTASAITGLGDGVLLGSAKRADGKSCETAYAEVIKLICTSDSSPATATFQAQGKISENDKTSWNWPQGSGSNKVFTATDAASTLLGNGHFDDFDDVTDKPDEWVVSVGTMTTTIAGSVYEQQTIAVTGPPTAGYYTISYTNAAGKVQTTDILAYNATAAQVQSALRALVGLGSVTVTSTGTSPLYTHTIVFTKVAGNVTQLTSTNNSTGGTYTHATTVSGSVNVYVGKALEFNSDGAQLTTINRAVTLEPLSQYGFNAWMMVDSVPAAGIITVDLVDGIGGTVVNDEAGTANSSTFAVTAMTTSFVAKNCVFRTPKNLPSIIYLRIRISTAISNTSSLFIDHASLAKMNVLYPGGPSALIFSGKTPFKKGDSQVVTDFFTLTVTDDRAGLIQEWMERVFGMSDLGLLLPSNAAGAETISDGLVA